MDEEIFKQEKEKLKDIVKKINKEENNLEQYLSSADMNYDLENIAQAQFVSSQLRKLENIKSIKDKPYFARMDFKEDGKNVEKLYIGKISLLDNKTAYPIIVDWRAPISNLYYEGRVGKAEYECLGEKIKGEIFLKRQYIIENQELKKYVNINVIGNDELLQNALEEKADDRLKNIVATIQDEQNKIIRADINQPLIVQGVAGSGKTTIALHRIAYLIYNYEKEFKPEEFMIIAPTKFFLNYISNILPDLGVNDVKQTTFEDLAPIMYIQIQLFGVKEKCKIKHVVIDEAQDYGEFQFDVLKTLINSNSMTILGDIAQGVHYYRGIENWKKFIDTEFKDVKTVYTTLQKTYRTTKEIMDVANNVISKLPEYEKEYIVLGEPVIDRKNSINIKKIENKEELIKNINDRVNTYIKQGYKSIAIIGKDMSECENLEKKLRTIRKDIKLIRGKDSEYNSGISIVPSYLAKGLEFDCVLLSDVSKEKYGNSSLDIKLLYVSITRAMSKLDVFYEGKCSIESLSL